MIKQKAKTDQKPKCKTRNHKFLEETIGRILFDIHHGNFFFFLDLSPKAKETKTKINKWDLIRHKSFCTAKEIINKTKRQHTKWEIISANGMTNTGSS